MTVSHKSERELRPRDLCYLADRAVTPEAAKRAGLFFADAEEGARLLQRVGKLPSDALVIPYVGVEPLYYRLRLDEGDVRFLTHHDRAVPLFVPQDIDTAAIDPIVVVEGPVKALALSSHGVPAAGLGGTGTTLTKQSAGRVLNDSWPSVAGKKVVLLFDSNRKQNTNVARDEVRLAIALERAGAETLLADLPGGSNGKDQGPDDFLAAKGVKAVDALLTAACPACPVERMKRALDTEDTERRSRGVGELLGDLPWLMGVELRGMEAEHAIGELLRPPQLLGTLREALKRLRARIKKLQRENARRQKVSSTRLRGEVIQAESGYCVFGNEGEPELISSFVLSANERVVLDDDEVVIVDVHFDVGKVVRAVPLTREAFNSRAEFLRAIPSADAVWTGSDNHIQGVKRTLSKQDVPRRKGTSNLGYAETSAGPRWCAPGVVIGPDGFRDRGEIVYVPTASSSMKNRVCYPVVPPAQVRELAARVLPGLLALNEPAVTLPLIGWFFCTPFRVRLLRLLGHFAILLIWGSWGSGKTSIVTQVFWSLFGVRPGSLPYSATETRFALIALFSSTDSIPVFIDEYRRDLLHKERDFLHRLLRRSYSGEIEERGRPDLSLQQFRISAPICLAGECPPVGDPALMERILAVTPNRNSLAEHPEYQRAFDDLSGAPLNQLAAPLVQFALGQDTVADLQTARHITRRLLEQAGHSTLPRRVEDNIVVVVLGLMTYEAFAARHGVTLPELDVASAVAACVKGVTLGTSHVKDALDSFVEALSLYAHKGALREEEHYASVDGLLCIHLASAHDVYLSERRRTGQPDDTNGLEALRQIIAENHARGGYVASPSKRVSLQDACRRTVAIRFDRIPPELQIEEFPVNSPRTWGGAHADEGGADDTD